MKSLAAAAVLAALLCAPLGAQSPDTQLTNSKGTVAYERTGKPPAALAMDASIVLALQDFASTGTDSLGTLTFVDSSKVLLGQNSRVQLLQFSASDVASAQMYVYAGHVRFKVEHPSGGHADYRFVTNHSEIAVRGTEGDVLLDGDQLRVSVYDLSDDKLPVTVRVTSGNGAGTVFELHKGDTLLASLVNGALTYAKSRLTEAIVQQTSGEFGLPDNWDQLRSQLQNAAQNRLPGIPGIPNPFGR
jgi:ferric-dicitrate binding protein FerR (iron transport regulator)